MLSPHTLSVSCQYLFQSFPPLPNSVQPLQAFIIGGDTQLSLDQPYILDVFRSSDPDYSDPASLYIWKRWNCSVVVKSKYVIES